MIIQTLTVITLMINPTYSRDYRTIEFVKSFIENERKPTQLIYELCWQQSIELRFVRELISQGVRCAGQPSTHDIRQESVLLLMDLDCPWAEEKFLKATEADLLRSPYRWLVISSSLPDRENMSYIWDAPLLADSDFVLAELNDEKFVLTELHKPSPTGPTISSPRGWYNGTLVDTRPHRELFRRRRNMMGHRLNVANVIQDSNTTKYHLPREDRLNPQFDSIARVCWSNIKIACEMLNATANMMFAYRWGFQVQGKWSGLVEDLRSGRADLGTNCFVRRDRLDVITYSDVLAPYRVAFVFRQPPLSFVSNIYSLPFTTQVWLAVAASCVLATAVLFFTTKLEAKYEQSPSQLSGSLEDAILFTMGAVTQQGCHMEPKKASGRILAVMLFIVLMALYAAYSANIVVLLQAPSNTIRTLENLAHSKITLAAHDIDYNYYSFKIKQDPLRHEITRRIQPEKGKPQFYSLEEGVERIRKGLFAFHAVVELVYRRIEETFTENEKCDLMEADYLNEYAGHVPFRKDLPYLELLKVTFKQIRESGVRNVLGHRFQVPKPRCSDKTSSFSSVGLMELQSVLILAGYGAAAAVFILLVEIVVFKMKSRFGRKR